MKTNTSAVIPDSPTTAAESGLTAEDILLLPESEQIRLVEGRGGDIRSIKSHIKRKPVYALTKRLFDIVASVLALILLSPLFLVVAVKIRKGSEGPAIWKQLRVKEDGKVFTMYKFRSMYIDAEERLGEVLELNKGSTTLMFKADNDPRVTPFGRIIRENSIDELPQLLNILKGEMSFVGPRPPLVREVIQYEKEHLIRLTVPGGLTCYWQLAGRNDADFDLCMEQDVKYIAERGWLTDIRLIIMTAGHVLLALIHSIHNPPHDTDSGNSSDDS